TRGTECVHTPGFLNRYERWEYEAERLVAEQAERVPTAVFRPSVIVDENGPAADTALSFVGRLIGRGLLPVLPGRAADTLDVVAAVDAASAIRRLVLAPRPGAVYHIASGDGAPAVAAVAEALRAGSATPVE